MGLELRRKGPLGTALAIVSEYSARVLVHRAATPARPFAGGGGGRAQVTAF